MDIFTYMYAKKNSDVSEWDGGEGGGHIDFCWDPVGIIIRVNFGVCTPAKWSRTILEEF